MRCGNRCFIGIGDQEGHHAPGDRLGWPEVLRANHHALLAHGKVVQAIRAGAKLPSMVGFAPVGVVYIPVSDSAQDIEAARLATFSISKVGLWNNTWQTDPVFYGRYPADGLSLFGDSVPKVGLNDMQIISQPLDFYGCNVYNATLSALTAMVNLKSYAASRTPAQCFSLDGHARSAVLGRAFSGNATTCPFTSPRTA